MAVLQETYEDRLKQAIIAKATRFLVMMEAPLGSWGEMTEFGMASVKPDYQIRELLYGMRFRGVPYDLATLVTTEDVIRAGLQVTQDESYSFPAHRIPDVERAIGAACSWIEDYLNQGYGFA